MEEKGHHKTPGRLKHNTSIRSECKRRHHTITFLHMDIPWTWISKFQDGKPRGEERSYNTPAGRQCWFKICAKILPVFWHQKVSGPRARHMQNPVHTVQSLERFAANSTANHRRKKIKCREKTEMQRSDPNAKRDGTEREFTTAEHRSLLTPLKNKFCRSRLQQQRERARRQKLEREGRTKETQL
jgi:hypothetical protein